MIIDPAASILVPCRNEEDHILDCLGSILRQEPPPGNFEVIVADGMSEDGTRKILQQLANQDTRLKLVENIARIVPTGLNAALAQAKGEIIIRMDAHTRYASDYVKQCVEILQQTRADNVGGPWLAEGQGFLGKAIAAAFQSSFAVGGARGHDPTYEGIVDTVYLGCWRRDVFDRVGLFDEELIRNQDDEFNLRLKRHGGKIWQSPRIRSWYVPRDSLCALFNQYKQYGFWKVRVMQKHGKPASMRHLIPAAFVLSLLLLPLASFWSPLAGIVVLALLTTYLACAIIASLITAAGNQWRLFPILPLVFACYHLGYGYGFLRGVWDFFILGRKPHPMYSTLTRKSANALRNADGSQRQANALQTFINPLKKFF